MTNGRAPSETNDVFGKEVTFLPLKYFHFMLRSFLKYMEDDRKCAELSPFGNQNIRRYEINFMWLMGSCLLEPYWSCMKDCVPNGTSLVYKNIVYLHCTKIVGSATHR